MADSAASLTVKGPIWVEAFTKRIVGDFSDNARHTLSSEGLHQHQKSTSIFKHPTGNYYSKLRVEKSVATDLITVQDLIYAPWLEWGGRGGFEGYHLWENTYDWLLRSKTRLLAKNTKGLVRRLND